MGKIISVSNQKGGVGKTTTSLSLAASLGVLEKKVLLVDADPQGNASSGIGISKDDYEKSSYDVLLNQCKIEESIIQTKSPNLDIIPANIDLVAVEIELVDANKREYMLSNMLDKIKEIYDFIIIDCPPSLGLITINALTSSDSVIIPIQCEYYALEGLSQLLNTFRLVQRHLNKKLVIGGVLMTMYDSRLNLSKQVVEEVKSYFKDKLFKTLIYRNVKLSEAPSFGKPALLYDASSNCAKNYLSLTEEILKRVRK